jgi:hypothetical protein
MEAAARNPRAAAWHARSNDLDKLKSGLRPLFLLLAIIERPVT